MTTSATATLSENLLSYLTPQERERAAQLSQTIKYRWSLKARPNQLPPPGDWLAWLILAGRGFGKTRSIVEWGRLQAETMPGSRGAIVGATAGDVRDILIEGESGLLNISPPWFMPVYEPSKRRVTWPTNGSTATLFSADEPDRLRGPQQHWAICDELAAWRYVEQAWDNLMFGLRLGDRPRVAIATTPRPIPIIKRMMTDPTTCVTRGSTYENRANLAKTFFSQVVSRYENTRIGQQELMAEILEDTYGALWHREMIQYKLVESAQI